MTQTQAQTPAQTQTQAQTQARPEVDTLLRNAALEAERILSLTRIAVALGLSLSFALSVGPTTGADDAILARQWTYAVGTMFAYLLLGAATYLAVRHGRFHRWMIWPTATADALFVVISVWTGMLNTGLSGDAVFVLPSIWLIPLVLAFGILRGDPWVMGWTVLMLSVGIGGLIVLQAGMMEDQTGHAVWLFLSLPPNAMRLAMILLAGLVLVLAAWRTRALLQSSIDVAVRNTNLTRYLPAQFAPQLAAGRLEDLRRGQREDIAVLFIDLRGFTQMSEAMSPQQVSDFVTEFRTRVARVVENHDGVIDKFMGDAAMVLFRSPADPARAAMNGLNCALALDRMMGQWSRTRQALGAGPLRAGVGMHFGAVFSGVVGDETRLEYSVFGDTVNVAARLQELSKQVGLAVLVSRAAVEAAGADGWVQVAHTCLRGREGDMDIMAPADAVASDPE